MLKQARLRRTHTPQPAAAAARAAAALAATFCLALLASCGTTASKPTPRPQPSLSEGQLQEKYLAKRNEARSLLERKQYGRSLDAFLDANKIRPGAAETLLGIGQCYVGLEYFEKAKDYFDRFLELDKEHDAATYYQIADMYWNELGLSEAAIKLLTTAIGQSPDRSAGRYYLLRGRIYARTGKGDAAGADLNQALTLAQAAKDAALAAQAAEALDSLAPH